MTRKADEEKLRQNRKVLDDEAVARERRIKMRREQKKKAEAAKRVKAQRRKFKLYMILAGLVVVALFLVIWFSSDLTNLLFNSGK